MQLKASTDYGLRAVLYLAVRGTTCSSRDIAKDMSIPRDYLIQLAQLLRSAGIMDARSGKNGGYCLAKDPKDISVLDVLDALEEETHKAMRVRRDKRQRTDMAPDVKPAIDKVAKSFNEFYGSLTLADLIAEGEN